MSSLIKIPECVHPDHVSGKSCIDKAISCSEHCACCNGSDIRVVNAITGKYIYGLSHECISQGIKEKSIKKIEISENGYWKGIELNSWERYNGAKTKFGFNANKQHAQELLFLLCETIGAFIKLNTYAVEHVEILSSPALTEAISDLSTALKDVQIAIEDIDITCDISDKGERHAR